MIVSRSLEPTSPDTKLSSIAATDEPEGVLHRTSPRYAHDAKKTERIDATLLALVRNEEGNSLYWLGVQYDITEQKRSEEEFSKSEERFRATFEQAAVGILQVGLDGGWLRFNEKFCDIVGYDREELGAASVFSLISPEDFDRSHPSTKVQYDLYK